MSLQVLFAHFKQISTGQNSRDILLSCGGGEQLKKTKEGNAIL